MECNDYCEIDFEEEQEEQSGVELINSAVSGLLKAMATVCDMICSFDSVPPISQNRAETIHTLADSVNLLADSVARFGYEEGEE